MPRVIPLGVQPIHQKQLIWRYIDSISFLRLVTHQHLYLPRCDTFRDAYEGKLPPKLESVWEELLANTGINISKNAAASVRPIIVEHMYRKRSYISSWCEKDTEDMSLWERYARNGFAICGEYDVIANTLACSIDPYWLFSGKVIYIDHQEFTMDIEVMNKDQMGLFCVSMFKHNAYDSEREIRFVHHLPNKEDMVIGVASKDKSLVDLQTGKLLCEDNGEAVGLDVKFDISACIKKIVASPYLDRWIFDYAEAVMKRAELNIPLVRSLLPVIR